MKGNWGVLTGRSVSYCLFAAFSISAAAAEKSTSVTAKGFVTSYAAGGEKPLVEHRMVKLSRELSEGSVGIKIHPERKKQKIDGFGAALTDACIHNLDAMEDGARHQLLRKIFDPNVGMNFNFMRLPLGSNDYSDGDYTLNDTPDNQVDPQQHHYSFARSERRVEVLREIQDINPQVKYMLSPWTAPAWMKSSQNLKGGRLLQEHFQNYAQYLLRSIEEFHKRGVDIDAMTILNEPYIMDEQWGFPQMGMSTDDQVQFIRDNLGPGLKQRDLKTQIYFHDHNWDLAPDIIQALNKPDFKKYVGGVSYHCYGGGQEDLQSVIEAHPDIPHMATECTGQLKEQNEGDFAWWMENLGLSAVRSGTSGAMGWNLCLDQNGGPSNNGCPDCRGMVTIDNSESAEKPKVSFNAEFYAIAQVSRFLQPGAFRLDSSDTREAGIVNAIFENPDKSWVAIVWNRHNEPRRVRLDFAGGNDLELELEGLSVVSLKFPESQHSLLLGK